MINIDLLKKELMRDEGVELKVYEDSLGIKTIGVGRNIEDVGITSAEAQHLLGNDLIRVFQELDSVKPFWRDLSNEQQRALANMSFNMGLPRLLGFKKMWAHLEAGHFFAASREALDSRWADQVGDRAKRMALLLETN